MNRKIITCPFCDENLTGSHEYVARTDAPGIKVALCYECGEPIIWAAKGFRRPTEDEYVEIYDMTNVREARDAFAAMKNGEAEDLVRNMWVKYFLHRLKPSLNEHSFDSSEKVYDCLQDVFMSGAAMILAYLKREIHEAESRGEFVGKMTALEIEIEAYANYAKGERSLS